MHESIKKNCREKKPSIVDKLNLFTAMQQKPTVYCSQLSNSFSVNKFMYLTICTLSITETLMCQLVVSYKYFFYKPHLT